MTDDGEEREMRRACNTAAFITNGHVVDHLGLKLLVERSVSPHYWCSPQETTFPPLRSFGTFLSRTTRSALSWVHQVVSQPLFDRVRVINSAFPLLASASVASLFSKLFHIQTTSWTVEHQLFLDKTTWNMKQKNVFLLNTPHLCLSPNEIMSQQEAVFFSVTSGVKTSCGWMEDKRRLSHIIPSNIFNCVSRAEHVFSIHTLVQTDENRSHLPNCGQTIPPRWFVNIWEHFPKETFTEKSVPWRPENFKPEQLRDKEWIKGQHCVRLNYD